MRRLIKEQKVSVLKLMDNEQLVNHFQELLTYNGNYTFKEYSENVDICKEEILKRMK